LSSEIVCAAAGRLRVAGEVWAFAAILVLAAALRCAILLCGRDGLTSDEAVIGLMAKHIFTRGETPLFFYGQAYAGGHALIAYLAAPLFALFGRSATLLRSIPLCLSLVNLWLVWRITRLCFGPAAALAAAALYGFSPPVVKQSLLATRFSESFLLAILALLIFLKTYESAEAAPGRVFIAGVFAGLAVWGIDYTILYPAAFVLFWMSRGVTGRRAVPWFVMGCVAGYLPALVYDFLHHFEHARWLLAPLPEVHMGVVARFIGSARNLASRDLAAFFEGDLKGFTTPSAWGWLHAAAAVLAVGVLAWRHRTLGIGKAKLPVSLLPVVFVVLYLLMYGSSSFSLRRAPRYLLPLCPFVSIAIGAAVAGWAGKKRLAGATAIAFLVLSGTWISLEVGLRPWHEEQGGVRTRGDEIAQLGRTLRAGGIRTAFAPYEIQWRLMFQTDEAVIVSNLKGQDKYQPYADEVRRRIAGGERFALIFRRDFQFTERTTRNGRVVTHNLYEEVCEKIGISPEGLPAGAVAASAGPEDYFSIIVLRVEHDGQDARAHDLFYHPGEIQKKGADARFKKVERGQCAPMA